MEKRTKLILCLFFFFSFGNRVSSQDIYYVTLVKGEIKRTDATKIKVGDKLESLEKLVFSKKDGRLILLHPQKGRFILEPGNTKQASSGEYLVSLMNNLLNMNYEKMKLSSRGTEDLDDLFTMDTTINDHLLFIGETKIDMDISKYRIKDTLNDFFSIRYTNASGKLLSRKLSVVNDSLLIKRTDFLFEGKEPVGQEEVRLAFTQGNGEERKITEIVSFKPIFMTLGDCKMLIKTIKDLLGNEKNKVIAEAAIQLYHNYGKPEKDKLSEIYDQL